MWPKDFWYRKPVGCDDTPEDTDDPNVMKAESDGLRKVNGILLGGRISDVYLFTAAEGIESLYSSKAQMKRTPKAPINGGIDIVNVSSSARYTE